MENPYFYAKLRRANGSNFTSIDGSLVSSICICSTRFDKTDYSPLLNPLSSLSSSGGFSLLNVDFRPRSISESLSQNVLDKTTSEIGGFDFDASGIYSSGGVSTKNWMQSINDLNGQNIFDGAIISLYLCSGMMPGAIYQGSDIWEDPTGEESVELTEAQWPYHRNITDVSKLLFVGIIKSIRQSGTSLSFDCDSWDSLLDIKINPKSGDNSSNSSINATPIIFGTAVPGVDGDHCACFPASQGSNNRSGTSFKVSAFPLYMPETKNICILDEKTGYAGVNTKSVKINSDTNVLTIAADTDATTLISRTSYQNWNMTKNERSEIQDTLGLYDVERDRPEAFKELPMHVDGEQIKIHTPTSAGPTTASKGLPEGGTLVKVVASPEFGGIVSRGWGDTSRKSHSSLEVYAFSEDESGIYMEVKYVIPAVSIDDKNSFEPFDYAPWLIYPADVSHHESHWNDQRGDYGDFWDVVRNSKYLDNPNQASKNIEFGNHLYVLPNGDVNGLPVRNGWILAIRPEEIESDDKDQLLSVKSSILYEISSIGDTEYTTTTDSEGRSYLTLLSGLNQIYDLGEDLMAETLHNDWSPGDEQPSGEWIMNSHKIAEIYYNYKLLNPSYPYDSYYPQIVKTGLKTQYYWNFTPTTDEVAFLYTKLTQSGAINSTDKQAFDTLETDYEIEGIETIALDNIATRGSNASGNWFTLKMTAHSDKVDNEVYHHSLKIFKINFEITVRKYLADYRVYSTGYGSKSSLDDSLVESGVGAISEVLRQYALPLTVTNSISDVESTQKICGWSGPDDTIRSLIANIAKSSLIGFAYGSNGSIYDYQITGLAVSTKTIDENDCVLVDHDSSLVFGITDISQLKTAVKLNFRMSPASGDYTASLYAGPEGVTDFTGRNIPIDDLIYLYDSDYWVNTTSDDLGLYCADLAGSQSRRGQYDLLEFNAPWVRDRETAERIFSQLIKLSTNQRTIITFSGVLESFYESKIGDVVDFDLSATAFDDTRLGSNKFRIKKKVFNCDNFTFNITVEEIIE